MLVVTDYCKYESLLESPFHDFIFSLSNDCIVTKEINPGKPNQYWKHQSISNYWSDSCVASRVFTDVFSLRCIRSMGSSELILCKLQHRQSANQLMDQSAQPIHGYLSNHSISMAYLVIQGQSSTSTMFHIDLQVVCSIIHGIALRRRWSYHITLNPSVAYLR